MEYQEFMARTQEAARLMRSGPMQEAIDYLYLLFLSDISDLDKAVICTNLAAVYDRMGNTEAAIVWYDKGMELEGNYSRYEVAEKKAQYLSLLGKSRDAVPIYENLLNQPFLSESDKERIRKIIQTMLGQAMRQWK
jgi:tetratricopeptide (TPR) repeat protein